MKVGKTVLLLGGGFLSQATAKYFAKKRYIVHIITPGKIELRDDNIFIHQGSLDDESILNETLPLCSTVIHLASKTIPGDSIKNPVFEIENNIYPTLRFLEFFQQFKNIEKLIYVSSGGALYSPHSNRAVPETQSSHPISYYGAGKVAIEAFLDAFANIHNRNVIILRPSNLYGPEQSLRAGFGLIRTMLDKILQNSIFEIWGDGEIVRDYLYISDMTNLMESLLHFKEFSGVFNVGSNRGYSIKQVKDIVEKVTGNRLQVQYKPQRNIDMEKVVLDCNKLRIQAGWEPAVDLDQGIFHTWSWLKRNVHDKNAS